MLKGSEINSDDIFLHDCNAEEKEAAKGLYTTVWRKLQQGQTYKHFQRWKVIKPRQNANVNQESLRLELKYLNLKIG